MKLWDILPGKEVEVFNKRATYNILGIKQYNSDKSGCIPYGDVSNGDDIESIQAGLALMVNRGCKFIVCACHTRKQFFKAIENIENTILSKPLENEGINKSVLQDIKRKINTEYQIIGCGHFCDWNINPVSISTSHKLNAIVGGVDLTELSAMSILNLLNALNR